ncbi:MAG: prepilin-type N-terminal cleavage/methylation domain-containing protein [Pirellulaceae bacterium]
MNRKRIRINSDHVHGLRISRQSGFTLVELMIALVLSLFLIGGAILISSSGKATYTDSEKLSRAQESIRFASDFLIRDIRNAGFRDRVSLKVGHEDQIREKYAEIIDGGEGLIIRYAGRGHCTQNFETFRLVENQYTLENGELQCRGRSVDAAEAGTTLITSKDLTPAIGLISGVSDIQFDLICPDGVAACSCDISTDSNQACVGVRIGIQFEAVRDLENAGEFEQRFVELVATFRNIGIFRIFENLI